MIAKSKISSSADKNNAKKKTNSNSAGSSSNRKTQKSSPMPLTAEDNRTSSSSNSEHVGYSQQYNSAETSIVKEDVVYRASLTAKRSDLPLLPPKASLNEIIVIDDSGSDKSNSLPLPIAEERATTVAAVDQPAPVSVLNIKRPIQTLGTYQIAKKVCLISSLVVTWQLNLMIWYVATASGRETFSGRYRALIRARGIIAECQHRIL